MPFYLYRNPECTNLVPYNMGFISLGTFDVLNSSMTNESSWNKSPYDPKGEWSAGKHVYIKYGINNTMLKTSANNSWRNINYINKAASRCFPPEFATEDYSTTFPTVNKIHNAFFISARDHISPSFSNAFESSSIYLQFYSDLQYPDYDPDNPPVSIPNAQVSIWCSEYGQNPPYGDGETYNREQWQYYQGNNSFRYGMSFNQNVNSQFTNMGFASVTMPWGEDGAPVRYIAVICGFDDSGNFPAQDADIYKGCAMLIPEEYWFDNPEEFDPYSPDPEESGEDIWHVGDVNSETIGLTSPTEFNPYGFNDSNTGHVSLSKANYAKFLGCLFGKSFTGTVPSLENIDDTSVVGDQGNVFDSVVGTAVSVLEQVQATGVKADYISGVADSLGALEKIRQTMLEGVLSATITPAIFNGPDGTIGTVTGYKLNTSIPCKVITNTMQTFEFSANIVAPIDSFLAYEPYTTCQIFAPFVGEIDISPSVLFDNQLVNNEDGVIYDARRQGSTVTLKYICDSYSGTVNCKVAINGSFYCERSGSISSDLPIVGTVKTGAAGKGVLGGLTSLFTGFLTGGPAVAAAGAVNAVKSMYEGFTSPQEKVVMASSSSNSAPMFSQRTPMYRLTYKIPAMPNIKEYSKSIGGMVNQIKTIGSFNGMCQFYNANLSTVNATQAVKEQILNDLREGVIINAVSG